MKDKVQREKADLKLKAIYEIIEGLIDYNGIANYDNIKPYTIDIDYYYDYENKCYKYKFTILRGIDENVCEFNLSYRNQINKSLIKFINNLAKKPDLLYTSFTNNDKNTYNLNFNNNVSVKFNIKSESDELLYTGINEEISKKTFITNAKKESLKTKESKDKVQTEKALKIIGIFRKMFRNIYNYNNLEDYENTKHFNFKLENHFDSIDNCYKYTLSIIRGTNNPKTILKLRFSIKDNKAIYSELYDLIINYLSKEELQYKYNTKNYNSETFGIRLNNNIELSFNYNCEKDKAFYENFKSNDTKFESKKHLKKEYN